MRTLIAKLKINQRFLSKKNSEQKISVIITAYLQYTT